MDNLIAETEKELKELKQELIELASSIKVCNNKEERQKLFDEKKEIQSDISEVENDLKKLIELRDNPVSETLSEEATNDSEPVKENEANEVFEEQTDTENKEPVEQTEHEEEE